MVIKSKEDSKLCFPDFHMCGEVLNVSNQAF